MERFLTNHDYERLIQADIFQLNPVLQSESTLVSMELTAQEEIEGYLKGRYDTALIFKPPRVFQDGEKYFTDDYVLVEGKYYVCIKEHIRREVTDTSYWKHRDPRSNLIIMYMIDIVLYHASTVGTVRDTPSIRDIRYEHAIKWLKAIRDDEKSTLLPRLAEDSDTPTPLLYTGTQYESDF